MAAPGNAVIYNGLGACYQSQGTLTKALAFYQKAVKLDGNYLEACCNLAHVLRLMGELEQSVICFKQALLIDPRHMLSIAGLGLSYQEL